MIAVSALLAVLAAQPMKLGYEYDITREKVPTPETIRRVVDIVAGLGYGQLQLYFKDNFAYTGHEAVWGDRDHLTAQEVKDLDRYCVSKGVELIPYQSSFGHLEPWFARTNYLHLAECPKGTFYVPEYKRDFNTAALCATSPESIRFIDGLFDELFPCFSSKYVNLGCDEVWDLHATDGRSLPEIRKRGRGQVYCDFILKLRDSVNRRGRTMMFWSDIIRNYPELVRTLPSDIVALDWNYEDDDSFEKTTPDLKKAPCRFYTCPGTSSWCSFWGRHANMRGNVRRAWAEGRRNGAEGLLLTDWGDNGYPQPWIVSLPALVYTAALVKEGTELSDEEIARRVDAICGCRCGASLVRAGNAYRKIGTNLANGTPLYRLCCSPAKIRAETWYRQDEFEAAVAELRAAAKLRDLAGAPDWVRDDLALSDLLVEFLDRRVRGDDRDLRPVFAEEYGRLWNRQNRPKGLAASLKKVFRPTVDVQIVVPAEETVTRKTAAKELKDYLVKATGQKVRIVREGETGPGKRIHLGPTAFAAKSGIATGSLGKEEWVIRGSGDDLVLAGGEPRGTLYAVYHYLEDVLGVHWFTPYDESVPETSELKFDGLALRGRPSMPYRDVYTGGGSVFLARSRMNVQWAPEHGSQMVYSRTGGGCHTMYRNIGTPDDLERLFAEHPEYFPLIDGRRRFEKKTYQTQFCLTNPGLRKLWIGKLREHIRADRALAEKLGIDLPMFYAVDQNDAGDGFCQCADCLAVLKRYGGDAKRKSPLLLDFANAVADALKDEVPEGTVFQMLCCSITAEPPVGLVARPNVGIRLADVSSNMLRPWTDPCNAVQYERLRKWSRICRSIASWDYSVTYGSETCTGLPTPILRAYSSDLRTLAHEFNGCGVFFEHEGDLEADMRDLKLWMEFKMAENVDADYEELLRTFTDGYYGKAGRKVRDYVALLEKAALDARANVTYYPGLSSYSFLDVRTVAAAYALRAAALAAVADDPEVAARVEFAFLSLDRYYLIRGGSFRKAAKGLGVDGLPSAEEVSSRYRRVWRHEETRRGVRKPKPGMRDPLDEFMAVVSKHKDLPVPAEFKDVPEEALTLVNAGYANVYNHYVRLVPDGESAAGEAIRVDAKAIREHTVIDREEKVGWLVYPFRGIVWPTRTGNIRTTAVGSPGRIPSGYRWYKVAEDVQLLPQSSLSLFTGFHIPIEGAVNDPSEYGQKYDVWASVKVVGDCEAFFVDQVAAIRKTRNY